MIASTPPSRKASMFLRASSRAVSRSPLWTWSAPQQPCVWRRDDLAAVAGEHADGGAVHAAVGERHDAAGEQGDAGACRALRVVR